MNVKAQGIMNWNKFSLIFIVTITSLILLINVFIYSTPFSYSYIFIFYSCGILMVSSLLSIILSLFSNKMNTILFANFFISILTFIPLLFNERMDQLNLSFLGVTLSVISLSIIFYYFRKTWQTLMV
jgi:K+-sensing histidine kinase KdpD